MRNCPPPRLSLFPAGWAVLTTVIAATCSGIALGQVPGKFISFSESPIRFSASLANVESDSCAVWHHSKVSDLGNKLTWDVYRRSGKFPSGETKLYVRISGPRTRFENVPFSELFKRFFKSVVREATNWEPSFEIDVQGRTYEVHKFQCTGSKHCAGLVHYWKLDSGQWKRVLIGYLCQDRQVIDDARLRDLLGSRVRLD